MSRTLLKWTYRCLGWAVLGLLALALLASYALDRHAGYGALVFRLTWNGQPFVPSPKALADARLTVRQQSYPADFAHPLRLRPGLAVVEVHLDDFLDFSANAVVPKDDEAVVEVRLRPQPRTITLRNRIAGATVNGLPCGSAYVITNAEIARDYPVEASAPGYETNHLKLRIDRPGQDTLSDLVLQPLMGGVLLKVTPLEGTAVWLNGAPRDPEDHSPLRVGTYSLTATNPDYLPFSASAEVTHRATNLVEVALKPRLATITIEPDPAVDFQIHDARGTAIPVRDHAVRVAPGTATLTLVARGLAPVEREFVLEPNKTYSWKPRLDRIGAADFEKAKEKYRLLTTDPANTAPLEKLGGLDWRAVRAVEFESDDLVRAAAQYRDAAASVARILQTIPERGRAWTNEVRAANAIDYWLTVGELPKATNELAQYVLHFGPQSEFEHWFGPTAGKVQGWRDALESKQRYLPEAPGTKKRR